MACRRVVAVLLALAALGLAPSAAPAAAPARDLVELRDGGAIITYKGGVKAKRRVVRSVRLLGLNGTAYRKLPFVSVTGTRAQLLKLARGRDVVAAHRSHRIVFELDGSTPLLFGGAELMQQLRAQGYDGHGVNVAVVDSGVNGLHPDLTKRMVANVKVLDPAATRGVVPPAYVECSAAAPCNTDTSGSHGTHVAGIVAGDGTASGGHYTGVAPRAGVVGLSVGDGASIDYALAAYDWLLAHPELKVAAVNNSWGDPQTDGNRRADLSHPVNVATRKLAAAGIQPVFSAGNTGIGGRKDPVGASECDTVVDAGGKRGVGPGICRFSVYGSAPWNIAVAMGRKDQPGGPSGQTVNTNSSRGDPFPQISLDGKPISYMPLLTAPGVNIRSALSPGAAAALTCASAEAEACVPPARPDAPFYVASSGTSMAAPQVTGAIAVIQEAAARHRKKRLKLNQLRELLVATAAPMPRNDALYDFPCGRPALALFFPCGGPFPGLSGKPYEGYQSGAGYLNVAAAIDALRR
jgi:serine protease AprX